MKSQIIKLMYVTTLLLLPQNLYAAQFGGGLGDAADETAATQQVQTEPEERSVSIGIWSMSVKNDELSAFSNKTLCWQKLRIEPQDNIQPKIVEIVGAVRLKNGIAAYSGETGTWDVLHLPETSTALPMVSPDVVHFRDGEHSYEFSAATGRWTSPTDPAMKALIVLSLSPKHISAADLRTKLIDWMQSIPASEVNGSIQWHDGVLSLLPRTKAWQEAAEAAVAQYDIPGTDTDEKPREYLGRIGPNGYFYPGGFGGASSGIVRQVSSNGLMITWSENNDEVRGFSNSKGDWEVLKIVKQDVIIPVVGDEVAAVRIGDSMAAFSATKAQWDVIKLSEGSKAVPSVFKGHVTVEDNGHLYTFAEGKGRWTSPTDPELQPATKLLSGIGRQIPFDREAFDQWLHTLPLYKGRGIQLTFQANVVTAHTTRQSWMKEVLAWVESSHGATESSGRELSALGRSEPSIGQIESDISTLREEFNKVELAVGDGIKKIDSAKDGKEDRQRELRKLVEQSFDLRQELQRLEAQRMKLKLQLIEANLDAREKAREAIIERRVQQLVDFPGGD